MPAIAESVRLEESRQMKVHWNRWGPYLSERAWGTVREDYSPHGTAWEYFPHDHARSRAYRWNEDGIAGICDRHQIICFALALWNERDPILKERMFGLTGNEGNHGEDVKEYFFYLDNTPTHSYMRYLYKYPQRAYPYANLVAENARRTKDDPEYELLDTGVFDESRYFDVAVEYAKLDADDLFVRIRVDNRGPAAAPLHVLPTLWLRNTWSWGRSTEPAPVIVAMGDAPAGTSLLQVETSQYGPRWLYADQSPAWMFTENNTNVERLWGLPRNGPGLQGRHQRRDRQPSRRHDRAGRPRDESRGPLSLRRPGRRQRRNSAAPDRQVAGRDAARRVRSTGATRRWRFACARPTSSTRRSSRIICRSRAGA